MEAGVNREKVMKQIHNRGARSPQAMTTMHPIMAGVRDGDADGSVATNASNQRKAMDDKMDCTISSQTSTLSRKLRRGVVRGLAVSGINFCLLAVFIGELAAGGFDDVFTLLYTSHPFLTAAGMAMMSISTGMKVIGFLRVRPV